MCTSVDHRHLGEERELNVKGYIDRPMTLTDIYGLFTMHKNCAQYLIGINSFNNRKTLSGRNSLLCIMLPFLQIRKQRHKRLNNMPPIT